MIGIGALGASALALWAGWWLNPHRGVKRLSHVPTPLDQDQIPMLRARFDGYQINPSDFYIDQAADIWRVNSDGSAHNLTYWHFNDDSGQFQAIKRKFMGRVIVSTGDNFDSRLIHFSQIKPLIPVFGPGLPQRAAMTIIAAPLGVLSFIFGESFMSMASDESYNSSYRLFDFFVSMPFYIVGMLLIFGVSLTYFVTGSYGRPEVWLGPEPLAHRAADHGPPVTGDAPEAPAVDLRYRPNQ